MTSKISSSMLNRIIFIMALLGVGVFISISIRLFKMQVVDYEFYQKKAISNQTQDKIVMPKRGTIYDRNMKPLADSATAEMVTIEPKKIESPEQAELIAKRLSEILGVDHEALLKKAKKQTSYDVVKRGVEKEQADLVREFIKENELNSIYLLEDSKRYYPFGQFASHILGFVGTDNQGLDGIESYYENTLKGTPGRIITATNAKGTEMPLQYEKFFSAQDGDGIVLTIDEVVQHFLEKNLEIARTDNKVAERVTGIIMDVKTGAILAMANKPDFDPNAPFDIASDDIKMLIESLSGQEKSDMLKEKRQAQWRNPAVTDTYEPGSTFKILTAAMAVEEEPKVVNEHFYCTGSIRIPGWSKPIGCWRKIGHGSETFMQAIQNSCNPAFVAIGEKVGTTAFRNYVKLLGLTEKTGIDLPGEASGIFHSESSFKSVELAVSSFGQTFQITPLQLITAVASVANGGKLMKPYIVKEILDSDGVLKKSTEPVVIRQTISEQTSKILMPILESVVTVGTGKNAYVAGYRVAGKTGTSEKKVKMAQTGETNLNIASFLGIAPADDPQVAVLVLLDEPTVDLKTGGITAAPVVGRIMSEVLAWLEVEPQYSEKELEHIEVAVPSVTGNTKAEAEKILKDKRFSIRTVGSGEIVTDQLPSPGVKIPNSSKVILYLGEKKPTEEITLPDLSGKTRKQAEEALAQLNLYAKFTGAANSSGANTVVARQQPGAESSVRAGTVVTVELNDLDQIAE